MSLGTKLLITNSPRRSSPELRRCRLMTPNNGRSLEMRSRRKWLLMSKFRRKNTLKEPVPITTVKCLLRTSWRILQRNPRRNLLTSLLTSLRRSLLRNPRRNLLTSLLKSLLRNPQRSLLTSLLTSLRRSLRRTSLNTL
ncbi:hypothetical protein ABL78_8216 [Leptomonas seymouri]|uniref:Uncharacterized protein n=1 Tax=Leptomonas seymouri TaxID=5684 RepID=A0A0N1IH95_LEPSE|nr:hypothetical protein ABL78_8216 [Leptomonas seymouri]|eukprot:KPI82771.1 hypothetical protein ABL78_8216 [Leptomonas seymouri]